MPEFVKLPTRHVREETFSLSGPLFLLPNWTLTYREEPLTDLKYIDPSITIDIFGRIANHTSKEVSDLMSTYELRHQ